jgi:flagellar basal body-associated protein FliL
LIRKWGDDMQKKRSILIIIMSILVVHILSSTLSALDSASDMQCGTEIVSVGASRFDVREKCGAPTSIELGQGYNTEQWIYNFGPSEFVYYLTFVNGTLERIEVGGYGD